MQQTPISSKDSNNESVIDLESFMNLKKGTIKTRILRDFMIISAFLVVIGAINYLSLSSMESKFNFVVEHDAMVLQNARELEKLVVDMETGQRGFIITGIDSFLDPYTKGIEKFNQLINEEFVYINDNPTQTKRLEHIQKLVEKWQMKAAIPEIALARIYHEELRLNKSADSRKISMQDVSKTLQNATGKQILDEIRVAFSEFVKEEQRLTALRFKDASSDSINTKSITIFLILFGGLGALFFGVRLANSIMKPILKLMNSAIEITQGNLDNELVVERNDEIGLLSEKMELMRLNLRKTLKELSDYKHAIDETSIVITTDSKGIITYVNEKFSELTKYSFDEAIGKDHSFLNSGHHPPEFFKDMWSHIVKGEVFSADMKNRAKDGTYYWVSNTIIPFLDEQGKVYQYVSIKRDITSGKMFNITLENLVESLKRSKDNQSQFLSNMSHEIRTPMNGILGMTRLLQKTKLVEEQKKYTNAIFTSANNLMVIIDEILDFSKIEAGKLTIEQTTFGIQQKLIIWNETLGISAKEKNIDFGINISDDVPECIIGDPVRLTQIIYNLGGNALKFTKEGKVTINIYVGETRADAIDLRVDVIDDGIGIAEDKLDSIFSSFSQASSNTTRKFGGTGLGLTITKQLIELQNGKIWVESELGKGSTFSFVIPYLIGSCDESIKELPQKESKQNKLKGITVLLVEDNEINQLLATTILEDWNFKVELAENGIEAVKKVKDNSYDIILMDIHMPEMDGYQATVEIRNNLKDNTPIIALTASAQISENEKCFDLGMNDFIAKPFDPELLLEKINTQLKNYQQLEGQEKSNIDLSYLESVFGNNPKAVKKILEKFLLQMPNEILELETLKNAEKRKEIKELAHKLRSSFNTIGSKKIGSLLEQIELGTNDDYFLDISNTIIKIRQLSNLVFEEVRFQLSTGYGE
ncbi:response regulator [Bacteroidota bacterium]